MYMVMYLHFFDTPYSQIRCTVFNVDMRCRWVHQNRGSDIFYTNFQNGTRKGTKEICFISQQYGYQINDREKTVSKTSISEGTFRLRHFGVKWSDSSKENLINFLMARIIIRTKYLFWVPISEVPFGDTPRERPRYYKSCLNFYFITKI